MLDADGLTRLREVISGASELVDNYEGGAIEALRRRTLDPTPVNIAAAAREIAMGSLLAVREAIANTRDPEAAIEAAIASLEMPESKVAQTVLGLRFLDFVERQRGAGHVYLFPELRWAGGSTGTAGMMGDVFYKKWWWTFERAGFGYGSADR